MLSAWQFPLSKACLLAAVFCTAIPGSAGTLLLKSLRESVNDKGQTVILNGQPADPEEYPVSFQSGDNNRICTWFMVSDQAIVGAAHCVAHETKEEPLERLEIVENGTKYAAVCSVSPSYWRDKSEDWAICKVSPAYALPVSASARVVGFEVINTKADRVAEGAVVEISGFGCTAEGGLVVDEYRVGSAKIYGVPPEVHVSGSFSPTPNTIKIRQFPSLLCEGDSGGPAFLYQKKNGRVHRVVVGINSSSAIKAGVSYLSSTSTERALGFFRGWSVANKVKLCGLSAESSNCRPFLP